MLLSLVVVVQTLRLVAALPVQAVPLICSPARQDPAPVNSVAPANKTGTFSAQVKALVEPKVSSPKTEATASEDDCCGYVVTDRDNAYFRYKHIIDFSAMSSMGEVAAAGWEVSDGWQAGGASDSGQRPIADKKNVKIVKGEGMSLTVPAQANGQTYSVAEVVFENPTFGGIFEVEAQLTALSGTCMGIFTYHADKGLGWEDEQDIEMLGESLFRPGSEGPGGMMLTNYNPKDMESATNNKLFPSNVDPSKSYHNFTISWFPAVSDSNTPKLTEYHFDGKPMTEKPNKYASTHPSNFIINHWTNGPNGWTGGPPKQDAVLLLKRVTMYYDRPTEVTNNAQVLKDPACTFAKACKVTMGG